MAGLCFETVEIWASHFYIRYIDKLKVPELMALLAFKAKDVPKGSKKLELKEMAKDAMKLPILTDPPMLALPAPPNKVSSSKERSKGKQVEEDDADNSATDADRSDFSDVDEWGMHYISPFIYHFHALDTNFA